MIKKLAVQLIVLAAFFYHNCFFTHSVLIDHPATENMDAAIISIPKNNKCYQSFKLKKLNTNKKYLVNWYSCDAPKVSPGEIWNFQLKLKPIINSNNPGGFNFKSWAQHNNIVATAGVITAEKIGMDNSLKSKLLTQQYRLYNGLKNQMISGDLIKVLGALTLGIKQELTYEIRQWFALTGTGHLLAISGLHIALIAGFIYFLILLIIKPVFGLFSFNHSHSAALIISFIILLYYTLLVGAPIPTVRALLMFGFLVLGFIFKRKIFFYYQWWLAAFLVLCFNPMGIFNVGFWFSFIAVFLLYLISTRVINNLKKWQQYFLSQWLLGIMLLPISLYSFSQFSLSGLFINLIAIPWVGFILLPLSIIGQLLILCKIKILLLWQVINFVGKHLLGFLRYFSEVKNLVIYQYAGLYTMLFGFLGVSIFIFFNNIKIKLTAVLCYLPLFVPDVSIAKGKFSFAVLNVGQGLSVVIRTKNHLLVYDAGEKFISGSDMAQSVIIPYLHYLGKNKINVLLVSHGDRDHSGGAKSLIQYTNVEKVLTSAPSKFKYFKNTTLCSQGQRWLWDGVEFEILYPDKWHYGLKNNSSCVLKITGIDKSALLAGDLEAIAEKNLVNLNAANKIKSDILLVPHHGSITSSSELLLNVVQPKLAIISCGYLNRFHFPNPLVLDRYKAMGVQVESTEHGAVLD